MRRADRLFRIVQLLRGRRLTTAAQLAEQLEVSKRTVYRDVQDLVASGVPIRGEAGVGYTLERGFELRPLVFNADELEALALGVRMAERAGDAEIAQAARSALEKIEHVLPPMLQERLARARLFAPERPGGPPPHLSPLRRAVNDRRKVRLRYTRGDGDESERVIRPVGLYCWTRAWSVAGWCELRGGWRSFRLDRIRGLEVLPDRFEVEEADLADYTEAIRREAAAEGCHLPAGMGPRGLRDRAPDQGS